MATNKSHELTTLDGTGQAFLFGLGVGSSVGSAGSSSRLGLAPLFLAEAATAFFFHDTLAFLSYIEDTGIQVKWNNSLSNSKFITTKMHILFHLLRAVPYFCFLRHCSGAPKSKFQA